MVAFALRRGMTRVTLTGGTLSRKEHLARLLYRRGIMVSNPELQSLISKEKARDESAARLRALARAETALLADEEGALEAFRHAYRDVRKDLPTIRKEFPEAAEHLDSLAERITAARLRSQGAGPNNEETEPSTPLPLRSHP